MAKPRAYKPRTTADQVEELRGRITAINTRADGSTTTHIYSDNYDEPAMEVRVKNDCSYKYVDIPGSNAKGLVPVKERRRSTRKY